MTSTNVTTQVPQTVLEGDSVFNMALTVMSSIGMAGCVLGLASKLTFRFVIPVAWKCCLWLGDLAFLALSLGLLFSSRFVAGASDGICKTSGFLLVFGLVDVVSSLAMSGFTHCLIQSPTKMSQLSTFRWGIFLMIVLPQKAVAVLLALLPVVPLDYYADQDSPFPLVCFPVRQEGETGSTFGAIVFFITWAVLVMGGVLVAVLSVRYWAGPGTRVHASSPSLWQMQKMEQARTIHKLHILETAVTSVTLLLVTVVVYTSSGTSAAPQWLALLVMASMVVTHVVLATVHLFMWSGLCGDGEGQRKEPHHRLKQLQLIRTDSRGRLRMKATWAAGKGVWRKGLLKIYGPEHIKAWAQEIVVLGLLRKSQSASVLQCLWTSNTNPYHETMTLISGDIVTSDSRLTCLELTSSGTLADLLKTMDVPLPEPCQRTIMHDVAEGLSYLHDQNVLHRNLTSTAVYLKGSVKCFVIRAAIGDFEEAQIYGTLLSGSPSSTMTKKRFFFPDIRSYALIGVELLARVCECRQREKQPHRRMAATNHGPHGAVAHAKHGNALARQHNNSGYGKNVPNEHHYQNQNAQLSNKYDNLESKQHGSKTLKRSERIDNSELSYCPPGEVNPGAIHSPSKHAMQGVRQYHGSDTYGSVDIENNDEAEYNVDRNWKLQMRANGTEGETLAAINSRLEKGWDRLNDSDNDYNPNVDRYKHSQIPGITNVVQATKFEFPNNSIFRAASEESADDLGMIEEEIERERRVRLVPTKGNNANHQSGYISSRDQDGKEIFIPAGYTTSKTSIGGTSASSGYGSSAGVYGSVNSSGGAHPGHKNYSIASGGHYQVHKTTSAATISSFEDDVLEVLPGMTDVEERPKRQNDGLLKELFKEKRFAIEEGLIESYEERVRRGELGSNVDGIPDGVVFPKKDKGEHYEPTVEELMTGQRHHNLDSGPDLSNDQHGQPNDLQNAQSNDSAQQQNNNDKTEHIDRHTNVHNSQNKHSNHSTNDASGSSTRTTDNRPKTAALTTTRPVSHRMQRAQRPLSASNTSFREWNARSSLKRNKARAALKRALSSKGSQRTPHHPPVAEKRGSRAKEVEIKYSNRSGSAALVSENFNEDDLSVDEDVAVIKNEHQKISSNSSEQSVNTFDKFSVPSGYVSSGLPAVEESSSKIRLPQEIDMMTSKPHTQRPTVSRKPSTKSRPAPPPPPNRLFTPIKVNSLPHTHSAVAVPSSYTSNSDCNTRQDADTQSITATHIADESFTSVEPASSSKSDVTSNTDNNSSTENKRRMGSIENHSVSAISTTTEKIESDMKEIIESTTNPTEKLKQDSEQNGVLPPGIRLIDSGFDSASVSSEESCLCAAAALQTPDDGNGSTPSEVFSQGTCSCACSNCLGSNPTGEARNRSSWTGSQDSESWSNSNSFSSYDANMYRRKLPSSSREKDFPILAPDEQYPAPSHNGNRRGSQALLLPPHTNYSPKRNHRRLSHTKGNTSSASETSSAASRRYRELMKKGVPLRVSVVAVDVARTDESMDSSDSQTLMDAVGDIGLVDNPNDDNTVALFKDLERQGFFEKNKGSPPMNFSDKRRLDSFVVPGENGNDNDLERYQDLSPIPSLEEIIKEIPDETGRFSEETRAFLNRPESELSIKAMQAVLSRSASLGEEKAMHTGELIIDRIFTHHGPSDTMASTFGLSRNGLDLDVSAIREVAMLPGSGSCSNDLSVGVDIPGLLPGMDGRHVTYCHNMSAQLALVGVSDLLPATAQALDKLRVRLQHTGRVGRIGNQILDTVSACWLSTTPPTSSVIVEQLSDRVTETEL